MTQYGTCTVYGVDGSVAINGAAAIAAFTESVEGEQRAVIEEFLDGFGELIGFRKRDEREYVNLIITPKMIAGAGSLNSTKAALKYPPIPSRITLSNLIDSTGGDLWGSVPSAASATAVDYIYVGGAGRTMVRGVAALRMVIFKPMTSPLNVTQLLTLAS